MLVNTGKSNDFVPELYIDNTKLEVVEQMKLLGVVITSDLKWHENTNYITQKAFSRLWMLRRLKNMGASRKTLIDIYIKQVRSVLEFAAVVWNAGLTKDNIRQIERVQKSAFAVILGTEYLSYRDACQNLSMVTLCERRKVLSAKFALKTSKHPIHQQWFEAENQASITRSKKPKYKQVQARTSRLLKSAIPLLTDLLNDQ